jgi:Sugar (and other) transporter
VKVVATAIFIFFFVDSAGRRWSLFISSWGMGTLFYIIGAILKTHPPIVGSNHPASASKAMAGLLYIYVCFYSMGLYFFPLRTGGDYDTDKIFDVVA